MVIFQFAMLVYQRVTPGNMEDFSEENQNKYGNMEDCSEENPELYEVMVHYIPWRWFGPHDLGKLYGNGGFFTRYHEKDHGLNWETSSNIFKHGNLLEVIVGSKSWAHCPYWGMVIKPFIFFLHYKGHQYGTSMGSMTKPHIFTHVQIVYTLCIYLDHPWPWHVMIFTNSCSTVSGVSLTGCVLNTGMPEGLRHLVRGHLPLNCF